MWRSITVKVPEVDCCPEVERRLTSSTVELPKLDCHPTLDHSEMRVFKIIYI